MSAYAHQMEQQYSARSLSGGSEMGSHYVVESGFYMTSFAAIFFISGLFTVGVLLITLVVSLAVMLQSCQSRNAGVPELQSLNHDYSYCKIYALHADLNNLELHNLPKVCRALAIQYVKGGQYGRDLDTTKSLIEDFFNDIQPSDHGLDVVLIDIDDLLPSYPHCRFPNDYGLSECLGEARSLKLKLISKLYMNLQAAGWPIILLSREPGIQRNVTTYHLNSVGFKGWSSLIMREEDEDCIKGKEYFARKSNVIQRNGFRIRSIISNHMDALTVADTGMRSFKLPDPICDKFEHQMETTDTVY
ncbi:acid phosphatase-like protein [Senna tora]|uniref:Acid phosphatase-like protein n=1 Tax=Senna tora TaxID=362788 RepID=A0A834T915_9FABA|nr:acid phosphatase-like protein [Senna tora]